MSDATAETNPSAGAETRPFAAEVSRLLQLMARSVYSNRDIFLRELISNAADACEKLRTLALETPGLMAGDPSPKIVLSCDSAAGTLTVEDNGIGMTRDELVDNLGTIARSGTRAFLDKAGAAGSSLIGQFGIGFYSAFMVADRVTVVSRAAGAAEAFRWESDGQGAFTIASADPAAAPARGTRVVLHFNPQSQDYAEPATVERIVAAHSSHVAVPIVLRAGGDEADKTLSDGSALWRKPKGAIPAEEAAAFYREITAAFDAPALTLHYRAEGRQEYSVLLFVPGEKPFDLFDPERKGRIKLYVRRVFITADADILPAWLRFVRGVIDSEDLPLNISREMLQDEPVLKAIGRNVTGRLLAEMERLARDDAAAFARLWEAFGTVIKEGLYEEPDRRDALFKLARFRTTAAGGGEGWRSLEDYVAALRPNQTAIYYALGESPEAIRASPQLEGFARRGIEVLVLADPVDAFWVRTALGFAGKPFHSVTQGSADLSLIPPLDSPEGVAPRTPDASAAGGAAALALRLKEALGARVAEVRVSTRLADSPVCLVAADRGPDRQLEKLLQRQGGGGRSAPILEINPDNGLIRALAAKAAAAPADPMIADAAFLLLGQATILDGETPENPAEFSRRIDALLMKVIG